MGWGGWRAEWHCRTRHAWTPRPARALNAGDTSSSWSSVPQMAISLPPLSYVTHPIPVLTMQYFHCLSACTQEWRMSLFVPDLSFLTPWCRILFEKLTVTQLVKIHPAFLWNQKVYYRVHKCPPLFHVLSQKNPLHIIPPHFLKIHSKIILLPTPTSYDGLFPLGFPTDILYAFLTSLPCYMPQSSHNY